MSFKPRTEFFNKNLFSLLIAVSFAIHGLIIFLSPSVKHLISLTSLQDSFIRDPGEYAVTLELTDTETKIKKTSDADSQHKEDEIKKKDEPKKYKIFTDTSDNAEDEETPVDTNKIGEKGSIAKDNFPNDKQPVNNQPHAEGQSNAPLLGKGGAVLPVDTQQQPQEQETAAQAFVSEGGSYDKNSPPRYANLPKGLESKPESMKALQVPHPQALFEENKGKNEERETVKSDKPIKTETTVRTAKRERLTVGRSIRQEEATEPLSNQEGVLFTDKQVTDKQDEINKESTTEEESLPPSPQEQETVQKEDRKAEKKETKNTATLKPEAPVPLPELPDIEPQRSLERGLDEQESQGATKKPKVSFNVNAKAEGTTKEPVLFEDTISNAAIPGATSFNVKKHEYADYFKHIRDRISLYWFLGYGTRAEIKLETKNDKPIIIEFKVLPSGSIDEIKIVDDAGNFNLASRLISSVKNASPLNPFPAKIKEPSIDVRFNFYFF